MVIKRLTSADQSKLDHLIQIIEDSLLDADWWLPIQETARVHFFDSSWTIFYGTFDGEELVGASALFLNQFEFKEAALHIGVPLDGTAEIGRCMVNPKCRGNNLMLKMNKVLVDVAKENGVKRIVATAHPSNESSCHSLVSLGMRKNGEITKYNTFKRNIYLIEL